MRLSKSLASTLQEVPEILLALPPRDLRTLQASCTQLRTLVHAFALGYAGKYCQLLHCLEQEIPFHAAATEALLPFTSNLYPVYS